ncbi:Hypothetical predicted protein, partial [Podarcis lilfordi]
MPPQKNKKRGKVPFLGFWTIAANFFARSPGGGGGQGGGAASPQLRLALAESGVNHPEQAAGR